MYDLNNQLLLKESLDFERFGLKGIGVNFQNSFNQAEFDKIRNEITGKVDIISCLEITANSKGDITKAVRKYRAQVNAIFVNAKSPEAMRAASEIPEVDIISHAFVDQVAARECAKNNVALEVNLKDILMLFGMKRANLISKIKFNLDLARKYGIDLVFTTGAKSIYDMRHYKQLLAFAQAIGFTPVEAKTALLANPRKIVERNRTQ